MLTTLCSVKLRKLNPYYCFYIIKQPGIWEKVVKKTFFLKETTAMSRSCTV